MLNQITIHGRLTKDPELRRTQAGIAVASATVACDRDFKNEKGERETDFLDVVAWRGTGEFLANYFKKGQEAIVSGRLQIRKWTDNDGNKRSAAEIVADSIDFCGGRNGGTDSSATPQNDRGGNGGRSEAGGSTSSGAYAPPSPRGEAFAGDFVPLEGDDEELPF